ncbi:UNVERIFIED_CONTAM: hypothetical protein FKN15_038435 [Acipenser sinensis]
MRACWTPIVAKEVTAGACWTPAVRYQRPEGVRPRIVAQQLWDHMTKWLRPAERGAEAVAQSVAIDQFLAVVGADTQAWVARHSPETMEKAVELAEAYEDSLLRASPGSSTVTPSKPRMTTPAPTQKAGIPKAAAASSSVPPSASPPTWRRRLAPSWAKTTSSSPPGGGARDKQPSPTALSPLICFRCHEAGHIARYCPAAMECDVASCFTSAEAGEYQGKGREGPCIINVKGGKMSTHALVDSGCEQTIIRPALLEGVSWRPQGAVTISCVHGETKTYPTTKIQMTVGSRTCRVAVAVAGKLPYPVIVGRDWPYYGELKVIPTKPLTVKGVVATGDTIGQVFPWHTTLFPSRFRPRKTKRERRAEKLEGTLMRHGWDLVGESVVSVKRTQKGVGVQCDRLERVTEAPRAEAMEPPLSIPQFWDRDVDLEWEQDNDPTLVHIRGRVWSVEGKDVDGCGPLTFPHFIVSGHLLYRVSQAPGTGQPVTQLLVPKSFRQEVLRLAHDIPFSGHLGREKTLERILARFYWMGLHDDVKKYVAECPDCQRVAPARVRPAPLVPLPLVCTPFERMAMDIVGPVLPSDSGYTHILVMVDYATR